MEQIKLSNRLQAIAGFVSFGAKVADIGTDHGYIPVWLAQNKIAAQIVAADINRGPLQHAKQTAEQFSVRDRIRFELCSGLQFDGSDAYDTVIIAGMGGELIASIIEEAPWTKRDDVTLILQPNSRIQHLAAWLIQHGYCITDAKLVKDAGKYYQILIVRAGLSEMFDKEAERLVNVHYFENHDPLLNEYLDSLLARYCVAEKGMLSGKTMHPELKSTQTLIRDLKEMKEAVAQWQP